MSDPSAENSDPSKFSFSKPEISLVSLKLALTLFINFLPTSFYSIFFFSRKFSI